MLSLSIAIPSALALTTLGFVLISLGAVGGNRETNVLSQPTWPAFIPWAIAFAWLSVAMWHLRQNVTIDVYKCSVGVTEKPEEWRIYAEGFISGRHPEGLTKLQLCLAEDAVSPENALSEIPPSIGPWPQKFSAGFNVPFSMFKKGRWSQPQGIAIDLGCVCATLQKNGIWRTNPFLLPFEETHLARKIRTSKHKGRLGISSEEIDRWRGRYHRALPRVKSAD